MANLKKLKLPISVFIFICTILSIVQLKLTENPIILLERFVKNGGWIELFIIGLYGAFVAYKMQNPVNTPKWRIYTWTIFSIVFFSQLTLGLLGFEKFLMTGELHLPIPFMILSGPVFRGQISFMTILFLSTIILSGPAWCSHLCYFGALDGLASNKKKSAKMLKNKPQVKFTLILLIITITLMLRWFNVSLMLSTILAIVFGVIGLLVILFISGKKGKMVHCTMYCPIGTIVNYFRFINPFRMYIDSSCTKCMACIPSCKYDALNINDIENGKPGITCTLCGDCITSCKENSIKYKFLKLSPAKSRNLYLLITISLHAIFLALGKI